ncbi:MAG: dihydroorotase [Pseudomonadota bacterium]
MHLSLSAPDDWHLHLRDGARMKSVVAHTAAQFRRALIMPNLVPPIETVQQAHAYRERILAVAGNTGFEPLMTLYLTPRTTPEEVRRAAADPHVHAIKLYPAGATTNSEAGVRGLEGSFAVLEAMAEVGLPLCIHGEVTDPGVDIFDRESRFVSDVLAPLAERFATLPIVLEHITTAEAASFVSSARAGIAATITVHHLLYNRNALFRGGMRPDYYCLPVLKRESHRKALVAAATSGDPRFFLGTDSAPHPRSGKHAACGCAGIYTAHAALPLYAQVFESAGALHRLEAFASHFGADFYRLPRNTGRVKLRREPWQVPAEYEYGDEVLTPLCAGETLGWSVSALS